jgi:hypothetical protein
MSIIKINKYLEFNNHKELLIIVENNLWVIWWN